MNSMSLLLGIWFDLPSFTASTIQVILCVENCVQGVYAIIEALSICILLWPFNKSIANDLHIW